MVERRPVHRGRAAIIVEVYAWHDGGWVVGVRVDGTLCSCFNPGYSWSNPPQSDDYHDAKQYVRRRRDLLGHDVVHALWDAGYDWDVKKDGLPQYEVIEELQPQPSDAELWFARGLREAAGRRYFVLFSDEAKRAAEERWRELAKKVGKPCP